LTSVTLSHVDHFTIPPPRLWQAKYHLIALSSFWGVVQSVMTGRPAPQICKAVSDCEIKPLYD